MLWPTFVSNLMALRKMSPGMTKQAGLLNDPLCAYLMKQNLYNQIRP